MDFFDLHCDTVTECVNRGLSLQRNTLAIDLERGSVFERWVQTFAFWIPDSLRGQAAYDCFIRQSDFLRAQRLPVFTGEPQIGCQTLCMVEGGAALAGNLAHIAELRRRGVRMMTLTWNGENELGAGAGVRHGGLKPFGKQAVAELERQDIVVDLSHANEDTFWDVARCAARPFVATHSNAYAVCPHPRNLKDNQICAIRDAGGLIGLNFYHAFLAYPCPSGFEALFHHIDHFLSLDCEKVLAIGSDFDGADLPPDIAGIQTLAKLRQNMIQYYGEAQTERILFGNAAAFFKTKGT